MNCIVINTLSRKLDQLRDAHAKQRRRDEDGPQAYVGFMACASQVFI